MWTAVISTVFAWAFGLFADANIPFNPNGYLMLRVLLPMLVMGAFILSKKKGEN